MNYRMDHEKAALKSGAVFAGLVVDDPKKFINLFLDDCYKLIVFDRDGVDVGYTIFEEKDGAFIFHLYNFTQIRTANMTEQTIHNLVVPYCKQVGLDRIIAKAERKGMAIKLERMGFKNTHDNEYMGEVEHVF